MNKIKEVIIELEGKILYAESTGNYKGKEELLSMMKILRAMENSKELKDPELCGNCARGGFFECGCKPGTMIEGKVLACRGFKGLNDGKV